LPHLIRVIFIVTYDVNRETFCNANPPVGIDADFHRAMVASAPGRITHRMAPPYEELDLRHEFERLFSGKSTKTPATRAAL